MNNKNIWEKNKEDFIEYCKKTTPGIMPREQFVFNYFYKALESVNSLKPEYDFIVRVLNGSIGVEFNHNTTACMQLHHRYSNLDHIYLAGIQSKVKKTGSATMLLNILKEICYMSGISLIIEIDPNDSKLISWYKKLDFKYDGIEYNDNNHIYIYNKKE